MAKFRWLIVDESSGHILDSEDIASCEECPNSNLNDNICRVRGGSKLSDNLHFPETCPLGMGTGRRLS